MPTPAMSFRPPETTRRQLDELTAHYTTEGLGPNQSQVIITAIDRLHAAVCRPAAAVAKPNPAQKRAKTEKEG